MMMNVLLPGREPQQKIEIIIGLTDISSENVKSAVIDFYATGFSETMSCAVNGIQKPALSRAKKAIEHVAGEIEKIKEIDWAHLNINKINS